jgi:hypothetical protein
MEKEPSREISSFLNFIFNEISLMHTRGEGKESAKEFVEEKTESRLQAITLSGVKKNSPDWMVAQSDILDEAKACFDKIDELYR